MLLEGTIQVVAACCAYAELDGSAVDEFLKMQGYDSASMEQGSYVFTLDIFDKAFGRVVTSHAVESLDLADLYGHPWHDHGVVGYLALAVGRADGSNLSAKDLVHLERSITKDLRYDYSDDELDFWFDSDSCSGALLVHLQDQDAPPDMEV